MPGEGLSGCEVRQRLLFAPRRLGMSHWAESHKPAADVPMQLLLAGLTWSTVGSVMAGFGAWWLWESEPVVALWLAVGSLAVGAVKSRLVLDRAARKIVGRICARGDGRCLGGFLSLQTWGLVILMMVAGRLLRETLARGIVGPLYLAVGAALCLSSRISWRAWRESRSAT
jgi:hypothetical protein